MEEAKGRVNRRINRRTIFFAGAFLGAVITAMANFAIVKKGGEGDREMREKIVFDLPIEKSEKEESRGIYVGENGKIMIDLSDIIEVEVSVVKDGQVYELANEEVEVVNEE